MPSKNPLISVVMPVKACNPEFLQKSVESILRQTFTNIELIMVMDYNSQKTENSDLLNLEEFENEKRVRIIFNKKKGFVEALNHGILASRGAYIARMDSDDISVPNRFECQLNAIEQMHLDLVGGWAYLVDEAGLIIGKLTPPTECLSIKRTIMVHNPFLHSAILFKKSILQNSGLYNCALQGAEDYELWLRIISLGYACANLPYFVVALRQTKGSLMRGGNWRKSRISYAKAKALGITKLGYHDPISVGFCFTGPLSLLVKPALGSSIKPKLRWLQNNNELSERGLIH